ncbi:MAG: hypothetical protein VKK42_00100 [Lyngbya sp.]|nr:hypothetical protein [Lyngbya sp.]
MPLAKLTGLTPKTNTMAMAIAVFFLMIAALVKKFPLHLLQLKD